MAFARLSHQPIDLQPLQHFPDMLQMLFPTAAVNQNVITLHSQREWGEVIGVGVHTYICMYIILCVCGLNNFLNRTLVIDSPFQTFAV